MKQLSIRILALIVGLVGVIIAFLINILYSSLHVLGRVAGITTDSSHFFWGLLVVLIGLVGSLLVSFVPIAGAVLLLVAGIAFFFIAGWWALLAFPLPADCGCSGLRPQQSAATEGRLEAAYAR